VGQGKANLKSRQSLRLERCVLHKKSFFEITVKEQGRGARGKEGAAGKRNEFRPQL